MRTEDRLDLAGDADRIEAARLAAERLESWMHLHSIRRRAQRGSGVWEHVTDSVGGVISIKERAGRP